MFAISAFNVLGDGLPLSKIVLTEPIGTRSAAMGGTGCALADDESALFYNPAGLGIRNERWESGALTSSTKTTDQDLLSFGYWGLVFQSSTIPKLGFSVYWEHTRDLHSEYFRYSKESFLSAGAGFNFFSNSFLSNSAGLALKWYHEKIENDYNTTSEASPLIREEFNTYADGFAVDLGYILEIVDQFRIGLFLKNIGPDYNLKRDGENIEQYTFPFQTVASLGYKKSFTSSLSKLRILDLASEISYKTKHSEIPLSSRIKDGYYLKSSYLHTGIDLCFLKSISARFGYVKYVDDNDGDEYKWHSFSWGIGLSLFNHFDFDFFRENEITKYAQYHYFSTNSGFSTSYKRVFKWSRSDRKWWFDK
jgi:hypothetical protein